MANIITSKFRSDSVRFFLNDLQNNDYYLHVSSAVRTTAVNSLFSQTDFLEKTIFGKKIDSEENFFYMIKNYPWQSGLVFDQYDDREDLADKRYYAVVYPQDEDIDNYKVYKCLFNNYGSPSQFSPNYNVGQTDQIYSMGDGYIWKFMYEISVSDFDKYNTIGYIPITSDTLVANADFTSSTVEEIVVTNKDTNNGYEKIEGTVQSVNEINGTFDTIVIDTSSGYTLSEIAGFYSGQSFYATNTLTGFSNVYTIDTYTFNAIEGQGVITLLGNPAVDSIIIAPPGSEKPTKFQILPRIEITGDGTGARAIADVFDGSIVGITTINKGSGYTRAIANVIDPTAFSPTDENRLDVRATLRPILSPRGGHASNLIDELSCKHCMLFTELTEVDNVTIPDSNQYSKIGLVKNPEFTSSNNDIFDNRISVELSSVQPISVNDLVLQVNTDNETIFEARVHEISANTVYLSEFHGPYQDQANTNFSIDPDLSIRSPQGDLLQINTDGGGDPIITYPIYVPKTGDVYYMNDFFSVERTEDSRELFKIVIEF